MIRKLQSHPSMNGGRHLSELMASHWSILIILSSHWSLMLASHQWWKLCTLSYFSHLKLLKRMRIKIRKLTRYDSGVLIFFHVGFFASVSERVLPIFPHSIVKLHLKLPNKWITALLYCYCVNLVIIEDFCMKTLFTKPAKQ